MPTLGDPNTKVRLTWQLWNHLSRLKSVQKSFFIAVFGCTWLPKFWIKIMRGGNMFDGWATYPPPNGFLIINHCFLLRRPRENHFWGVRGRVTWLAIIHVPTAQWNSRWEGDIIAPIKVIEPPKKWWFGNRFSCFNWVIFRFCTNCLGEYYSGILLGYPHF